MHLGSDIYLVGLGIYGLRQLTVEADEILRSVQTVYHFSTKHEDLCGLNSNVHDMRELYAASWTGPDIYAEIARVMIDLAKEGLPVAVAFDGNPLLYCSVGWQLVEQGAKANLRVEALAGVSCFDVLPIELGFDPGDLGMQTLESTAMVQYGLSLNPFLSTLLLQIAHFGVPPGLPPPPRPKGAYTLLVTHLLRYFPSDHPAIFIQSASSAASNTCTLTTCIAKIDDVRNHIVPGMTLYVPRLHIPCVVEVTVHQT